MMKNDLETFIDLVELGRALIGVILMTALGIFNMSQGRLAY